MKLFWKFFPFWMFLFFFKFAANLHYTILSPLGEHLMPLWIVGFLIGGGSLLQLVLDVPAGYLLDKYGYRFLLKVTTLLFLSATLCFYFGLTTTTFVLSVLIATFGWLFFNPGIDAYVLSQAPNKNTGRFMSYRDVSSALGVVVSGACLPFILFLQPKEISLFLNCFLAIAFAVLLFSPKDVARHETKKVEPKHIHRFSTLHIIKKLNPASTMLLLLILSGSIFYGVIWFVIPILIAHQIHAGVLSFGLGIFDVAIVLLGFLLGNIADKVNKRTLVFFGLLLFSLSAILIGFHFDWLFLLLGFLATTGDEMAGISLWSWLHALDHEHTHDGTISGTISLCNDLGWAIGPIAAGILMTTIGSTWTIVLGAIPIFLTWIIYQFFLHRHPEQIISREMTPKKPHRHRSKT